MARQRLRLAVLALMLLPLAACRLGGGTTSSRPAGVKFPPVSAATPTTSAVGFAFKTSGYTLHAWPAEEELQPASHFNPGASRDSTGAIRYQRNGKDYNHPVNLAQDGMIALAAYQETGDAADLRIALADATQLVKMHTESAGAWWYPYPFDFPLYGLANDTARAPWYSAMAQGEACDLFTRLYLQTHDAQWRTAADHTFASFLHPYSGDATAPWVVNVADGYLWLQEYPKPQPDYTINGAFFAIAGIAKYALTFQDARAALIADGAMTTMLAYTPKARHPGWISSYSLTHMEREIASYHGIVTKQLLLMYTITRDTRFAAQAFQFIADYPIPDVSGKLTLPAGTYTLAHRGVTDGVLGSKKQVTFSSTTELAVSKRYKIADGAGYWYQIHGGPYDTNFIQESATIHLADPVNVAHFSPPLSVTLRGTYHVYAFTQGQLHSQGTMSASATPSITLSGHATIGGVDVWQVASGQYAGQYLAGAAPAVAA